MDKKDWDDLAKAIQEKWATMPILAEPRDDDPHPVPEATGMPLKDPKPTLH